MFGRFRAASLRTTLLRFFLLAGRDGRHGRHIVQRLVDSGLMASSPIIPQLGRASQRMLTQATGWKYLGLREPKRDTRRALYDVPWREYYGQLAYVATERAGPSAGIPAGAEHVTRDRP